MTATKFQGFPKSLPEFFIKLAANNNRDWFEENKSEYQAVVVKPAFEFIDAMEPIVSGFNPSCRAEARLNGSLRRINRDIRFSKDKTPYNPRLHMIFWAGSHPNRSPAFHVVLGAKHFGFGAGQWGFDKAQLDKYRTSLLDPGNFEKLSKALKIAKLDNQLIDEPPLKRLPKGFEAEGMLADMLRQKGVVVKNENEPYDSKIFTPNCVEYVHARMQASQAVNKWLFETIK